MNWLLVQQAQASDYEQELAQRFGLQIIHQLPTDSDHYLAINDGQLTLLQQREAKLGGISVDFVEGKNAHRRQFGGGRGEAIAKAVGLNKGVIPTVFDVTAGLGRDAFVLASLGCTVYLFERHPMVAALLFDGLQRGQADSELGQWLGQRMQLRFMSAADALTQTEQTPDVVYLDPMYPHREKSALVKKEMRVFQGLVGADVDADSLLELALAKAKRRVVVKRPDYAEPLANRAPHSVIATKKNRFDLYINAAMGESRQAHATGV